MQGLVARTMFLGMGLLTLMGDVGCKKESDEAPAPLEIVSPPNPSSTSTTPLPIASFEPPTVVQPTVAQPTEPPAKPMAGRPPAATASQAPSASAAKPANAAADGAAVKECCVALRKEATGPNQASYDSAAKICDGIAALVAKGTTRREAALTSIRAAVRGGKLPAGCQ